MMAVVEFAKRKLLHIVLPFCFQNVSKKGLRGLEYLNFVKTFIGEPQSQPFFKRTTMVASSQSFLFSGQDNCIHNKVMSDEDHPAYKYIYVIRPYYIVYSSRRDSHNSG